MNDKIKTIGIIVNSLRLGGTERVAARLSELWQSIGIKIIFITREPSSTKEFKHTCNKRILIPKDNQNSNSLKDAIEQNKIDIVVYNGAWNSINFDIELKIIKKTGAKLICILHHSFTNWAFYLSNAGDFFKESTLKKIDRLVCVNPVQALWWKNKGASVSYIQNPRTFLLKSDPPYNYDAKSLVWIGRPNDPGKGLDEAITIFICVKKIISDVRLIILGDLNAAHQNRISQELTKHQFENGVVFAGYCSDISKYLRNASVHILTSIVEVSSPMVIAEAAAFGVPTVLYDLPVATESKKRNGVIAVQNRNRNAFINTLVEILSNRKYAEELSSAASLWIRQENQNEIIEKWIGVFTSLYNTDININNKTTDDDQSNEFETIEMYRRLTHEINRSQNFFIHHHFWKLKLFVRWTNRIGCIRKKVAERLTSFFDTIR